MKASIALVAAAAAILLAACAPTPETSTAPPTRPPAATPSPSATVTPPLQPVGEPTTIVTGLNAPWSMVRLDSGSTLISERDTALIRELQADGTLRDVAQLSNVRPDGEGGLLGLLVTEIDGAPWLYAYYTSLDSDNRIVRFPLTGGPGSYALGDEEPILTGIARSGNHNGGRIAIGPDGMLYATSGDASDSGRLAGRDIPQRQDPADGAGWVGPGGQPDRRFAHLVVRAPQPAGTHLGRVRRDVGGGVRAEHLGRDQLHPARAQLRLAAGRGRGRGSHLREPVVRVVHRHREPERAHRRSAAPSSSRRSAASGSSW